MSSTAPPSSPSRPSPRFSRFRQEIGAEHPSHHSRCASSLEKTSSTGAIHFLHNHFSSAKSGTWPGATFAYAGAHIGALERTLRTLRIVMSCVCSGPRGWAFTYRRFSHIRKRMWKKTGSDSRPWDSAYWIHLHCVLVRSKSAGADHERKGDATQTRVPRPKDLGGSLLLPKEVRGSLHEVLILGAVARLRPLASRNSWKPQLQSPRIRRRPCSRSTLAGCAHTREVAKP